MLNVETINDKSILIYNDLNEANIPEIKQRFEILAEERGVSVESLKNKKELDLISREENQVNKERDFAESLLESDLNNCDDDIVW